MLSAENFGNGFTVFVPLSLPYVSSVFNCLCWSLPIRKESRVIFSISDVRSMGHSWVGESENESWPLPYTIHTIQVQMIVDPNVKEYNNKGLKENIQELLHKLREANSVCVCAYHSWTELLSVLTPWNLFYHLKPLPHFSFKNIQWQFHWFLMHLLHLSTML